MVVICRNVNIFVKDEKAKEEAEKVLNIHLKRTYRQCTESLHVTASEELH